MTIQTGDNKFSVAKWIVDPTLGRGTHTTIQAAINSASAGDTIFLRPATYTEDLTLKAGVNIVAFEANADSATVLILGKATYTGGGTVVFSGISIETNSDFFLVVSGAGASDVEFDNCLLICSDNTGISFTSSNVNSVIAMYDCVIIYTSVGIALFSSSSVGGFLIEACIGVNPGLSTTIALSSAGPINILHCNLPFQFGTTGTAGILINNSYMDCAAQNGTPVTANGTGSSLILDTFLSSGTSPTITIGVGASEVVNNVTINSSNANPVTGLGTLVYGVITFVGNSSSMNVSNVGNKTTNVAGISFDKGTNVLDTYTTGSLTLGVAFGGGTTGITYGTQIGTYFKIGKVVFISATIVLTSKGSSVGAATLTGLPFTTASSNAGYLSLYTGFVSYPASGASPFFGAVVNSNTIASIFSGTSSQVSGAILITNTDFSNNTTIGVTGFYYAAS